MTNKIIIALICSLALTLSGCSMMDNSSKTCPYMEMKKKCEAGCSHSCNKMKEMKEKANYGSCNSDCCKSGCCKDNSCSKEGKSCSKPACNGNCSGK
jgi:hypothetical protein